MDFIISTEGDLSLEGTNLLGTDDDRFRVQLAMCKIASVTHDWFYDNVGCDLEELIGKPLNDVTLSTGSDMIYAELFKTKLFDSDDIKITSKKLDNVNIGYNVYIKNLNQKYYYHVIEVCIDIVKGIDIKIGDDMVCLY